MIDVKEAMIRALKQHFEKQPISILGGVPRPRDLVTRIVEGWSDPVETLVPPVIEIDAPIVGESSGGFPKILSASRVLADGTPTTDESEPNFLYTVFLGGVEIPLQVRVTALSKQQRADIDEAIKISLQGDFDSGSAMVFSEAQAEYYGQSFNFRQVGTPRNFDSTTTAGREEFVSIREVEGAGAEIFQFIAAGFNDLTMGLKVTEAGRDFANVPSELFIAFEPS